MKIKKGWHRIAIVTRYATVKIPKVRGWIAIKSTFIYLRRGRAVKFLRFSVDRDGEDCIWYYLLHGIAENWREYKFYRRNTSPFPMPTVFSLFGLFNIQKTGAPVPMDNVKFWIKLLDFTNEEVVVDLHHFSNIENFCGDNGHLRIVDYSSPKTHPVLKKYGKVLYEEFEFPIRKS